MYTGLITISPQETTVHRNHRLSARCSATAPTLLIEYLYSLDLPPIEIIAILKFFNRYPAAPCPSDIFVCYSKPPPPGPPPLAV